MCCEFVIGSVGVFVMFVGGVEVVVGIKVGVYCFCIELVVVG